MGCSVGVERAGQLEGKERGGSAGAGGGGGGGAGAGGGGCGLWA